uniref:ATP synthase complex subunit 8 n=1 Tax=Shinkaia crosnieri TaxID=480484 RepID=B3TZC6_SHICR|nr:ATP synthase F0 subunit 8 [Shinkaia crosnieri]
MPQMGPILWLNLLLMFLITFMLFFISNYFIFQPKKMISTLIFSQMKKKIWKW